MVSPEEQAVPRTLPPPPGRGSVLGRDKATAASSECKAVRRTLDMPVSIPSRVIDQGRIKRSASRAGLPVSMWLKDVEDVFTHSFSLTHTHTLSVSTRTLTK